MNAPEAITKLRDDFVTAFNHQDIGGLAELITEDHISMPPNGSAVVGKDAILEWWKQGFKVVRSHVAVSPKEIEVAGEWAFERFEWTMDNTIPGGEKTSRDTGKNIWIYRKQPNGSWKVARSIWNSDEVAAGTWSGESISPE